MQQAKRVYTDMLLIGASILLALLILKFDIAAYLLEFPEELLTLTVFLAGVCFVSVFTVAPATIVLGQLAIEHSLPFVALLGGLGALGGDFIIFKLFRDRIADDLRYLLSLTPRRRLRHVFRSRATRWVSAALGALVIASPLPDEIGLAMLGLTRIPTRIFIPLAFVLNATGIFMIGLIARTLQ